MNARPVSPKHRPGNRVHIPTRASNGCPHTSERNFNPTATMGDPQLTVTTSRRLCRPPGSRSSSHLFFASFSYISMKEQLLQKSVKILSLESNKSNTTVGIQSGGNSRYFLFIKIDCLKIRKKRREHHINMCRRSELSEWKRRVSLVVPELFCIGCPDYLLSRSGKLTRHFFHFVFLYLD